MTTMTKKKPKTPAKPKQADPDIQKLLRDVDEYQDRWAAAGEAIPDSVLGRRINYGGLIERLRGGSSVQLAVIKRLRRHMKENPPPRGRRV